MVGSRVAECLAHDLQVFATAPREVPLSPGVNFAVCDLQREDSTQLLKWSRPDIVIHCAAWTDVGFCEKDKVGAYAANCLSVLNLLKYSESRMIFLSSDAVFPERSEFAYEDTLRSPQNHYGFTKMVAEDFIFLHRHLTGLQHTVIRCTPVGFCRFHRKTNFLEWVAQAARQEQEVTLFDDALFTPIDVDSLVGVIETLVREYEAPQTIHVGSDELISKYEFGMQFVSRAGLSSKSFRKGSIRDLPSAGVSRSSFQGLGSKVFCAKMTSQRPSLENVLGSCIKDFQRDVLTVERG